MTVEPVARPAADPPVVSLAQIVAALSATYKDHGVMCWLLGANTTIANQDSPLRCIRQGRIAEVAEAVRRIGDSDPADFEIVDRTGGHRDERTHPTRQQEDNMIHDRPEDIANREYYNHKMMTRRVRITYEADVEWREDDPDYCLEVVSTDWTTPSLNVRMRDARLISTDLLPGEPKRVDGGGDD